MFSQSIHGYELSSRVKGIPAMSSSEQRRREELRRIRKQQARAKTEPPRTFPSDVPARLDRTFDQLQEMMAQLRTTPFPGASDGTASYPDQFKYAYARWLEKQAAWRTRQARFEQQYRQGPLGMLGDIDHWAMEKFFWQGDAPQGEHPLDAFLQRHAHRYSPTACAQFRQWKQAQIGLFEIGSVQRDTVKLRPFDIFRQQPVGPWRQAIDLSMQGAATYAGKAGMLLLTYLAPWNPAQELDCALGFSGMVPRAACGVLAPYLNLQHSDFGRQPWPWQQAGEASRQLRSEWPQRNWQAWLRERIATPFSAVVVFGNSGPQIVVAHSLSAVMTDEEAREYGVYLDVTWRGESCLIGATGVVPCDLSTPTAAAVAEYVEYRRLVGPPPKAHLVNAYARGL